MQRWFDCFSEDLEWLLSNWWGVSIYFILMAASYWLWDWDGLDRYIYVTGAAILVLLVGANRRDSKATHAKLDDIDPREEMNRIEEKTEKEIEEMRNS